VGEQASLLGLPREFAFNGKTVKVAPRDFEVEGAFSVWAEEQGLKAVQRHQRSLSPAEYDLLLAGWRRDCQTSVFDWGEPYCWQLAVSEAGQRRLAALQISMGCGMGMTEALAFVAEVFDDPAARKALQAVLDAANQDPNRKRPWPARAGG